MVDSTDFEAFFQQESRRAKQLQLPHAPAYKAHELSAAGYQEPRHHLAFAGDTETSSCEQSEMSTLKQAMQTDAFCGEIAPSSVGRTFEQILAAAAKPSQEPASEVPGGNKAALLDTPSWPSQELSSNGFTNSLRERSSG